MTEAMLNGFRMIAAAMGCRDEVAQATLSAEHEAVRLDKIAAAERAHEQHPQYRGHWNTWRLARVTRTVKTKMGVAFVVGDLVIATTEPDPDRGGTMTTAYSERTGWDTSVREGTLEFV